MRGVCKILQLSYLEPSWPEHTDRREPTRPVHPQDGPVGGFQQHISGRRARNFG